jgi:nucleoside-diphosphate-sugar epimerase
VGRQHDRERAGVRERRRRDQPRLLLHRQRDPGQPAGGDGGESGRGEPGLQQRTSLNQLYEGIRTSLLPRFPHLADARPVYRDFRAGDVRHSLADIGKARSLLGYEPTHRLGEGLAEAMEWYVDDLS